MSYWIDVHTHLEMLEEAPDKVLDLANQEGIQQLITIGTHPDDNKKVIAISEKYFPKVVCTLGIHPHEAKFYDDQVEAELKDQLLAEYVVGVGEIGLDFYYNHSDPEVQKQVFRKQLDIAEQFALPVQIHTRDAEKETVEILKDYQGRVKGMIHCFTGTRWLAEECLALGWNISLSGVVTFKNSSDLRETLKIIPLNRLHIETDAPFLAPVPMRGKKNTPAFMVHTAKLISVIKAVSELELRDQVYKNALKLFTKLPVI